MTHDVRIVEGDLKQVNTWGYAPKQLQAQTGDTVVWTNTGSVDHTVTADDASFDSGNLAGGATFRRTFTAPGVFAYKCAPHPWMTAVVVVADTPEEAAATALDVDAGAGPGPGAVLASKAGRPGTAPPASPAEEALEALRGVSIPLPVALGLEVLFIALSAAWLLGGTSPLRQRTDGRQDITDAGAP
ncbi:MAG TPA: plastocyanin/azurin family copper-binding protein [Actinomycetota bacterium]|nr:plastocyanin/azurin family copper-binding protein [Actinomycetota bacterium]